MEIVTYDKLVRDKIPELIEKSGKRAVVEKLHGAEYKKLLDEKLAEELQEYFESNNIEELADLVEVVRAILDFKGVSADRFENIRQKKAMERGIFKERLLLREVIQE